VTIDNFAAAWCAMAAIERRNCIIAIPSIFFQAGRVARLTRSVASPKPHKAAGCGYANSVVAHNFGRKPVRVWGQIENLDSYRCWVRLEQTCSISKSNTKVEKIDVEEGKSILLNSYPSH
jgi:hypothetical protein